MKSDTLLVPTSIGLDF